MEANNVRIRRVHVLSLINLLAEMYNRGVDFVDVYGLIEDGQDTIGLTFNKEYMDPELADNFDKFTIEDLPKRQDVKLSDEDLNQLI